MPRSHHRQFAIHACGLALVSAVSSTVFAAELGEVVVRSHIGQQLSADIELVMLTSEDAAGVQVKLAAPNVYQGANTRMHPALSSMRMSVVKRDNRQFLHLTTFQPVEAEILHLFLELGTGNRASVRSATIWLTAEPVPAPVPVPVPTVAPLRPAAPVAASAVASMMVADAALAAQSMQAAQSAESRAVALRAARMRAAAQNALAAKESLGAGNKGAAEQASGAAATAAAAVKPGPAAVPITLGPEASVKRGVPGGVKAACTPGQSGEAQQCLALDRTNTELKTKLIDLEGKVKLLQAALGQSAGVAAAPAPVAVTAAVAGASASASAGTSAAAVAAASAGAVPAAGPAVSGAAPAPGVAASAAASADGAAKPVAKKKKEASGINNTTLILGGVLLLALVLGLLAYIIRKKKFKFSTAPLKVWQGWRKDKKPAVAEAPAAVEPILSNE